MKNRYFVQPVKSRVLKKVNFLPDIFGYFLKRFLYLNPGSGFIEIKRRIRVLTQQLNGSAHAHAGMRAYRVENVKFYQHPEKVGQSSYA